jgi:hypothetical protein
VSWATTSGDIGRELRDIIQTAYIFNALNEFGMGGLASREENAGGMQRAAVATWLGAAVEQRRKQSFAVCATQALDGERAADLQLPHDHVAAHDGRCAACERRGGHEKISTAKWF